MVEIMDNAVSIDRQGRLVLPSHVREALGLKEGGQVTIRFDGSRVVLEPVSKNVEEKVEEWVSLARNLRAEAFSEEHDESWKWMSHEYARRKLGLS